MNPILHPAPSRRIAILLGCILAAYAVRIVLLLVSTGTDDAYIWWVHGAYLRIHGFAGAYESRSLLNHPPIPFLTSWYALRLSEITGIRFSLLFKLPILLGDVLTAWVLFRAWRCRGSDGWTAATAWAWSPVAILVGQYHCNTDSVVAGLTLASAHLLFVRRPGWAGLVLACAVNVKIIPILLLPVLAAACPDRRALIRFALAFAGGLTPFLIAFAVAGMPFIRNVFGYAGFPGGWGFGQLLSDAATFAGYPPAVAGIHQWYLRHAREVVLGAMSMLALAAWVWRSRWTSYELAAMGMALFLICSPAFATQYLVLPLAAMMAARLRRGVTYGVVGGILLLLIYGTSLLPEYPLRSALRSDAPPPSSLIGLIVWSMLVGFVVNVLLWPAGDGKLDRAES